MKIKSSYRKPTRRLSRRNDQASFFGSESESDHPSFFNPSSEARAKDEGATFLAKEPEEEEVTQAKEEEEETVQAKEEEEETMQAKEEEEEPQPKADLEKGPSESDDKCGCGCEGKTGEPDEQRKTDTGSVQAKEGDDSPTMQYQKCDAKKEEPVIKQAVSAASTLAGRAAGASTAIALLGGEIHPDIPPTQGQLHHKKWFGKFHQRRATRIARNYRKIAKALTGKLYFNCGCKKNIYAYVYPGGRRKIYLCKKFWGAVNSGFDSKPGVIVHELAHEVNKSIGDKGYGTSKAENLAKNSPRKAATNADNYEYYAESV